MANVKHQKKKILVIVGPTASGKSELAVSLAKRYHGEIISADSRQVYKFLDVGSNKVPGNWTKDIYVYKKIPHYCIDFVHPKKNFTVAEYKDHANEAIKNITAREKLPILVGGTGFYISAVVDGISLPEVPPNAALRKKLEKKSVAELFRLLQKKDPARAKTIDPHNPRRLIRALEIIAATGRKVPKFSQKNSYNSLVMGIKREDSEIKKRIESMVQRMMKTGLLREVRKLRKLGISKKRIYELGFEYSSALECIEKKISKKDLPLILAKENWSYVKRQMTWFKKDKRIHWIKNSIEADTLVKTFLNKK